MAKIELPGEKQVGHLTLLRTPRSISAHEYNALSFEERLSMVRSVTGRQKYDLLLEAKDAQRLVRAQPVQDLYLMIKELGVEYAPELVALLSTEQLTSFFDLDCWKEGELDGESVLGWLSLVVDESDESIARICQEMDYDLLALIFQKFVTVVAGPESYDDEEALKEALVRNGAYEIRYADPEHGKIFDRLLDVLFRTNQALYASLLGTVRYEQKAVLEEEVLHFRQARLADQGFSDPFEAMAIYSPVDPDTFDVSQYRKSGVEAGENHVAAPAYLMMSVFPKDLLGEIFSEGVDADTGWEMSYLLNKVLQADRVDIGNSSEVRTSAEQAYNYLNIGLQFLCGTDVSKAAELFRQTWAQSLFQLGFSLTARLQKRVRSIDTSCVGPYLEGPHRALVNALKLRKPLFYEGVESPERGGLRPFACLQDIKRVEEWLDRIELLAALFERHFPFQLPEPKALQLEGCVPDSGDDLTLSDFFLTALANKVMGRSFLPLPIPETELTDLHARIAESGKVSASLRKETQAWLESLEPGAGILADGFLEIWDEELCGLAPGDLDPRYVGGLLIKLA